MEQKEWKTPVDRIHARGRFSGKPGLHRMKALCAALGDPQKALKFVHLAGTNGKGSTAAMIAAVLQQAGYRTGLFTSPYLVTFHERIRVDGQMIDDASLTRLIGMVEAAEGTLSLPAEEHIGEFEFVTALGLLYFVEQGCDIVVLETGLGGAFDASNVIGPPEVAVITSISLDHMAVLGDTVEEIARTKAGIIKPGSAVVCADGQTAGVMAVLRAACPTLQVPAAAAILRCDLSGSLFRWQGETYEIGLIGAHQIENGRTALQVILALRARGWCIPEVCVKAGLSQAFIPARMQIMSKNPLILLDGGHNEGGVKAIANTIRQMEGRKGISLVIGMLADKNTADCAAILAALAQRVYVTAPPNARALPAAALAEIVHRCAHIAGVFENCDDAFAAAADGCASDEAVLICGSLYLAGQALAFFEARQKAAK